MNEVDDNAAKYAVGGEILRVALVPSELKAFRQDLLDACKNSPESTEGINLQRVRMFLEEFGLNMEPYIMIEEDTQTKLEAFLRTADRQIASDRIESSRLLSKIGNKLLDDVKETPGGSGILNRYLGIPMLRRSMAAEDYNSAVYTEGSLIHEEVHANNPFDLFGSRQDSQIGLRAGFALFDKRSGFFIEEGYPHFLEAEYVRRYLPSEQISQMTRFSSNSLDIMVSAGDYEGKNKLLLPAKYCIRIPMQEGWSGISVGSRDMITGFTLELLIQKNPKLLDALKEAKKSVQGLRRVAQELDAIYPGLYTRLRDLPYTELYQEAFEFVRDKIYGGEKAMVAGYLSSSKLVPCADQVKPILSLEELSNHKGEVVKYTVDGGATWRYATVRQESSANNVTIGEEVTQREMYKEKDLTIRDYGNPLFVAYTTTSKEIDDKKFPYVHDSYMNM